MARVNETQSARVISEILKVDPHAEYELADIFQALADGNEVDVGGVASNRGGFNPKKKLRHLLKAMGGLIGTSSTGFISDKGHELVNLFQAILIQAKELIPGYVSATRAKEKRQTWMTQGNSTFASMLSTSDSRTVRDALNASEPVETKPAMKSLLQLHQEGAYAGINYKGTMQQSKPGISEDRWGASSGSQLSRATGFGEGLSGGNVYRHADSGPGRKPFEPQRDLSMSRVNEGEFSRMVDQYSSTIKRKFTEPKVARKFI